MENKDTGIEHRYLKKLNFSFFYNYFTVILMISMSVCTSFFFEIKPLVMLLGVIPIVLFIIIFLNRKRNIITSVGIYKYSEIFMEILKSIIIRKKELYKLKSAWKTLSKSK